MISGQIQPNYQNPVLALKEKLLALQLGNRKTKKDQPTIEVGKELFAQLSSLALFDLARLGIEQLKVVKNRNNQSYQMRADIKKLLSVLKNEDTFFQKVKELFNAIHSNNIDTIQDILLKEPEIIHARVMGDTALHYAAIHATKEVIELLINMGADLTVGNNIRDLPMNYAEDIKREQKIIELLQPPTIKLNAAQIEHIENSYVVKIQETIEKDNNQNIKVSPSLKTDLLLGSIFIALTPKEQKSMGICSLTPVENREGLYTFNIDKQQAMNFIRNMQSMIEVDKGLKPIITTPWFSATTTQQNIVQSSKPSNDINYNQLDLDQLDAKELETLNTTEIDIINGGIYLFPYSAQATPSTHGIFATASKKRELDLSLSNRDTKKPVITFESTSSSNIKVKRT